MPGIEIKGRSKIANYRHGGRTGKFGGGRTNLLEQLGRVEAEPSNPNRRAEISRVHGELNRGYAKGGRAGFAHGMSAIKRVVKRLKKYDNAVILTNKNRHLQLHLSTHLLCSRNSSANSYVPLHFNRSSKGFPLII